MDYRVDNGKSSGSDEQGERDKKGGQREKDKLVEDRLARSKRLRMRMPRK